MATKTQSYEILTRIRSPFDEIFVLERENLREMWFQGRGRFYLQSRMDRDCPDDLALVYTRLLLAPLLLNPEPARILMIGLGGGSLPRFLHGIYPKLEIDVVEVDPRVVELARRYFDFSENPRLRVHTGDGREFIQQRSAGYDMVFLDAFKSGSVPYHLKTVEFYREIAQSLKENGLLATNLYGKSNGLKPRDRKTLESVFPRILFFEDSSRVATVCVAALQAGCAPEALRKNLRGLPEKVQRNLSWLENMDMIDAGNAIQPSGSVFKDDFEASGFFKAVERNNRSHPFGEPLYPIRNSP